jgi:K(+)-stimulated pyrophosphate-energized sodium pump
MCDSLKCTPEQKEACLSHYGADGKFIAEKKDDCCAKKDAMVPSTAEKNVKVVITNTNGKAKATVTTTVGGTSTSETFEGTEAEVKAKVEALK